MEDLKTYIDKHKVNKEKSEDFVTYLYQLMDKYGFDKNADLYNKANISRQHWSAIISYKVTPELKTVIKIVDMTRACRANSESERKRNHTSKGYIWEFAR